MEKRITFVAAFFATLLAAAVAAGQATEVGRQNLHHGTITDIDYAAETLTLETRTGPVRFTLQEGAKVVGQGERKSFDTLAVGETITVRAIQDENQRWLVGAIQVVDPHEIEGQVEDFPAFDEADTVTVTRVDAEAGSLEVESRQGPRVYQVTPESRIVENGGTVPLASLEPGERVVVSADENEAGRFTARIVTVVSAGPEPAEPETTAEER